MVDWKYERFTVKPEHLKLLRSAYIGWEDCEFGAPAIDCKRPYGNSWVYGDIAEILGIEMNGEEFTEEQKEYMRKLHEETQKVLQILVQHCKLDDLPMTFICREYSSKWKIDSL